MKVIKFDLRETESCLISLAYMYSNADARTDYKTLQNDIRIEYPSNELDIISSIITNYSDEEEPLLNLKVIKGLRTCDRYSEITDYAYNPISESYYKAFIERIKGNIDSLDDDLLISYTDSKKAFISYIGGNLKALINSSDEYKFIHWNGKAWNKITEEECKVIYDNFINQCEIEFREKYSEMDNEERNKAEQKISKWDNKNRVNEALAKIQRSSSHILDIKKMNNDDNIFCSQNGKIINLNNGTIKESCRDDLVLNISKFNLVDREQSDNFMNREMEMYIKLHGTDRINFMLDFIAYKMLGKNIQSALFMIGTGATGKTTFSQIMNMLFDDKSIKVPYEYFTNEHRGNDDKSRDDIFASLDNKHLCLSSESEQGQIVSISRLKRVLSNDDSESSRKSGKNLMNVNLSKLDIVIDTNSIPEFTHFDYATSRRLKFICFDNKIPVEQRNTQYFTDVIKPNADYIFSFFVYRAIGLIGKKLEIPKCIENDTMQNLSVIDSLLKFTNMFIAPFEGSYIECKEFEKKYEEFCKEEGTNSMVPEDIQGKAKGYNFILNKIKDYDGFGHVTRPRKGKYPEYKYIFDGITFKDDMKQQEF